MRRVLGWFVILLPFLAVLGVAAAWGSVTSLLVLAIVGIQLLLFVCTLLGLWIIG